MNVLDSRCSVLTSLVSVAPPESRAKSGDVAPPHLSTRYILNLIRSYILHITGSVQIMFMKTIKYDNIYSTLKVNNKQQTTTYVYYIMRYKQYIKRYNCDISLENGKGSALFLICSESEGLELWLRAKVKVKS